MRAGIVVNITGSDRHQLEAIISDRSAPQKHVWRAMIILATDDGCGTAEIMRRSGKSKPVVWRWQARFMSEGVEGLTRDKTRKPGKKPLPAATVQSVVGLALGPPPGEATHWTGRMLAKVAGVSLRSVQRILEAHQLAPHRIRLFKLSSDPKFVEKLKDVVGLYVDPPAHAVVLSVDEKSQIQALDRTQPGLPMKPGRAGTMTHDYKRRYHHALRCPQHPRRHRHRPQHAAPSAPGVHPLPQYDRGAGPCGKSDPRSRRQLRDPQTSKGAAMAGATSTLGLPLHPNLGILAQRGRRVLRQAHAPAPQARCIPVRRRPATHHQPLRCRYQRRPQTLRLDGRSKAGPGCYQTREANVRVSPLAELDGGSLEALLTCLTFEHCLGRIRSLCMALTGRSYRSGRLAAPGISLRPHSSGSTSSTRC
jgi:Homeodomain-like domain